MKNEPRLDYMQFARALRTALQEKGLSQSKVARILDVEQTSVSSYCCARTAPAVDRVAALEELLDLRAGTLEALLPSGRRKSTGIKAVPKGAETCMPDGGKGCDDGSTSSVTACGGATLSRLPPRSLLSPSAKVATGDPQPASGKSQEKAETRAQATVPQQKQTEGTLSVRAVTWEERLEKAGTRDVATPTRKVPELMNVPWCMPAQVRHMRRVLDQYEGAAYDYYFEASKQESGAVQAAKKDFLNYARADFKAVRVALADLEHQLRCLLGIPE